MVGGNFNITGGLSGVASSGVTGSGGIWVGRLGSLFVALEVLEGFVLPSTIASIARGIARDELLLGEAEEGLGSMPVLPLNGGGG